MGKGDFNGNGGSSRSGRPPVRVQVDAPLRANLEQQILRLPIDDREARRARLILALADGCDVEAASRLSGVSEKVAYRWRARFLRGGAAALKDLPRSGAPRRYGDAVRNAVLALQDGLSLNELLDKLRERGVAAVSRSTLHRILKQAGNGHGTS